MSLESRISECLVVIGGNIKTLIANDGNLSVLTTTNKSSLVGAINELNFLIGDMPSSIAAQLAALKADILGGANAAYDTLKELQDLLMSDASQINALLTALANRVRFDDVQTLNTAQKAMACANIGIGNPEHDFLGEYIAARGVL